MARANGGGTRRVLVITGDHELPDATKWDGRYSADDLALHAEMRRALESLPGYEFEFLTRHADLIHRVANHPPDLVLNLCDTGFGNLAAQEPHVPALLEMLGIAYSGAGPASMVLCYDKSIVRMVAEQCGVPTPREYYAAPETELETVVERAAVAFPALVKPARGDGSVGINRQAVVRSRQELAAQLAWLRAQMPQVAALVQEYLPGPEYGLALIGNPGVGAGLVALPPLEIDFSGLPPELPPILAFESKTGPQSAYEAVVVRRSSLSPAQVEQIKSYGEKLFLRLECRDYARFDFRTAADGEIKLMEVNPNPAWSPAAKLALMARFGDRSYPQLLGMILTAAEQRTKGSHGRD